MTGSFDRFLQCAEAHLAQRDLPAAIAAFDRAELSAMPQIGGG